MIEAAGMFVVLGGPGIVLGAAGGFLAGRSWLRAVTVAVGGIGALLGLVVWLGSQNMKRCHECADFYGVELTLIQFGLGVFNAMGWIAGVGVGVTAKRLLA